MVILKIPEVSAQYCRAGNKKGVRTDMPEHAEKDAFVFAGRLRWVGQCNLASRLPSSRFHCFFS